MEVIYLNHSGDIPKQDQHVMAIGFFDGVHLGHQRLFQTAKMHADELGVECSAMTFSPHPDEVIKGDVNRKYITPLPEKIKQIEACGIDKVFVMKFDKVFASLPPMDFVDHYITKMNARHVVVGFDFTFGKMAKGNVALLKEEANNRNYGLSVIPQLTYHGVKIGSTITKQLIEAGEVAEVPKYLGTNYEIKGKIKDFRPNHHNNYVMQTVGQHVLPEEGTFSVSVKAGNTWYDGDLTIGADEECHLVLYNAENITDPFISIVFLDKSKVKQAILV